MTAISKLIWHPSLASLRGFDSGDISAPSNLPPRLLVSSRHSLANWWMLLFLCAGVSGQSSMHRRRRDRRCFAEPRSLSASDGGPEVAGRRRGSQCAVVAPPLATRVRCLSVCCLRVSQDRSHLHFQLWSRSRRLRISKSRPAHGYVGSVAAARRSEEQGHAVGAIGTCVGSHQKT